MGDLWAMKAKGLIWPLVILLGACNEKPAAEATAGKGKQGKQTSAASPSGGAGEDTAAAGKDGKSATRPDRPKKPAIGSVAPGQPGMALSPYSNQPVDVKGLAPGSLVQDPKFPGDESKKFIVPEGVEEETVERPMAKALPGRPGFVISPYNGKIIDVTGMRAGGVVADPTYPSSEKKHFRVPAEAVTGTEPAEGGAVIGSQGGAATGGSIGPKTQEE